MQLDIKVGDKVRSYDFPDSPRRELSYVIGTVTAISPSCYTIAVSEGYWNGKFDRPYKAGERIATPPINGRPLMFGVSRTHTDGVERI